MIEMLGVLAIIGVLSAGGIMGYSVAMENYKVNKLATDIEVIIANINTIFKNRYNVSANSSKKTYIPALCTAGAIPNDYCANMASTYNTKSPWGSVFIALEEEGAGYGTSSVAPALIYTNAYRALVSVRINDLPSSVCVKMLSRKWNVPNVYFMQSAEYNGNSLVRSKAWPSNNLPSTSEVESKCRLTTGKNFTFAAHFYLDVKLK